MFAIGKVWKSVTGREAASGAPPRSVTPRDLAASRSPTPELAPSPDPDPAWSLDPEPSDTRAAERFVPLRNATTLIGTDGRKLSARIINISRVGVAVEADFGTVRPRDIVTVGTRPVTLGRRIALGAVFVFRKPLDPKLCDPSIIL